MSLRETWRRARAAYRAAHPDRCSRCARKRDLPGKWCSLCLAEDRERRLPGLAHERYAHALMLVKAWRPWARCKASGLRLWQLHPIGRRLVVDRIDPFRGYVHGNMQLLADTLNSAKGRGDDVPHWAVDELHAQLRPRSLEAEIMRGLR